jgi:hypothetical protein
MNEGEFVLWNVTLFSPIGKCRLCVGGTRLTRSLTLLKKRLKMKITAHPKTFAMLIALAAVYCAYRVNFIIKPGCCLFSQFNQRQEAQETEQIQPYIYPEWHTAVPL